MTTEAMEYRLDTILAALNDADKAGQRREFMNAILRTTALICAESPEPEQALGRAIDVIKAAFMEQYDNPDLAH